MARGRSKGRPGKIKRFFAAPLGRNKKKGGSANGSANGATNGSANGATNGSANGNRSAAATAVREAPPYPSGGVSDGAVTVFDADKERKNQSLWTRLVVGLVIAGLGMLVIGLVYLVFFYNLFGSGEGGGDPNEMNASDKERAAGTYAEEFSREYLKLDPDEDPRVREERLAVFLAEGLKPRLVSPAIDPDRAPNEKQLVLSSAPYRSEALSNGNFLVETTSLVRQKSGDSAEKDDKEKAGETVPERVSLQVHVGVDGWGRASVVAPPTMVSSPGGFGGEAGALTASDGSGENLEDAQLKNILDGYFAAFYGRSEARNNLQKFFAPEAVMPTQPPGNLVFQRIESGVLYPRLEEGTGERAYEKIEVGGVEFEQVYDAEIWITVNDEEGMEAVQTQLVTVGTTPSGDWLLAGDV